MNNKNRCAGCDKHLTYYEIQTQTDLCDACRLSEDLDPEDLTDGFAEGDDAMNFEDPDDLPSF